MQDNPPPYPGINPNYTPTFPNQPNGTAAPQQPGFAGAGFAANPPPYQPQGAANAAALGPQAGGSTYPSLPPNGFNNEFQPGPSAPTSSKLEESFTLTDIESILCFFQ